MTSRKTNSSRKLSFQALEDRQLMAANVTAALNNHTLNITGDNNADTIQIVQVGQNKFKVIGENGTKVNGHSSQTFSKVTGDVNVTFNTTGSVTIGDPNKSDVNISIQGNLNVNFKDNVPQNSDDNYVGVIGAKIGGALSITSAAADRNDVFILDGSVGSDCNLNLTAGENDVFLSFESVGRDLVSNIGGYSFNNAHGNTVELTDVTVGRNTDILTGSNADFVQLNGVTTKGLDIDTGDGNDEVVLGGFDPNQFQDVTGITPQAVTADAVYVELGNGDDFLQFGESGSGGVNAATQNYVGDNGTDHFYNASGLSLSGNYYGFENKSLIISQLENGVVSKF